jgi:chromosome segregation ATPase
VNNEQQTQQADDPSGPGWRDVSSGEILHVDDMVQRDNGWGRTRAAGTPAGYQRYRRRIEQQQASDSEPETMEQLRKRLDAAVRQNVELADELANEQNKKGAYKAILKRTMERAREAEALVAEAERSGQQVNAELQQLREQVQKLERELKAERDSSMTALRSQNRLGQEALAEALQTWLRPVLELVAEHPEEASPLAVAVLGYLPGIASRLIEE